MSEPTWFQKQLEIARERTKHLPDWARREAGLEVEGVMSTCSTCGQPVRVSQSDEGTGCYLSAPASEAVTDLSARILDSVLAAWRENLEWSDEFHAEALRRIAGELSKAREEDKARQERAAIRIEELGSALQAAQSIFWMAKEYAESGGSHGPEMRDYNESEAIVRDAMRQPRNAQNSTPANVASTAGVVGEGETS